MNSLSKQGFGSASISIIQNIGLSSPRRRAIAPIFLIFLLYMSFMFFQRMRMLIYQLFIQLICATSTKYQ